MPRLPALTVGGAALRQSGNPVNELLNRIVGLPEAVLNAFGALPAKQVRVRVVVLLSATGSNVLGVPREALTARFPRRFETATRPGVRRAEPRFRSIEP